MSTRKSTRIQLKSNTPCTPSHTNFYSPRLRNSVKRNLNNSFGAADETTTPNDKAPERITLIINKTLLTSRHKYYYYESCSDDDDETKRKKASPVINSKRKAAKPRKSDEDFIYISPIKQTRLHETPKKNTQCALEAKTPKTPRIGTLKATPRSTLRLIKDGVITPKVPSRCKTIESELTPLKQARNQLHVSYVPVDLPCREKEFQDIYKFLEGKLFDSCGGCMYISGVPGTGKTATVTSVISHLIESSKRGILPEFQFININGMKLTEPRQAYVEIVKQLIKKTLAWEQALGILEEKFTKKSKKSSDPIILLVDELDIICTKRQDVVYNILDWPSKANTQLIVITIANTMDLPERLLMNRVTSRLGLTRLPFQAYTHKQLQEIVTKRLIGTNTFNADAVQLVARKVASVSGDARRALDICRRAAEIAENEGDDTFVSMVHVNQALKAMITQPKVQAIKNCSILEQYVLQAVISDAERTGIEETIFRDVFKMLTSLCALNGFKSVSCTVVLRAIARLSACRLLLVDQKCSDLDQRIILNVSADDVYYALKEE